VHRNVLTPTWTGYWWVMYQTAVWSYDIILDYRVHWRDGFSRLQIKSLAVKLLVTLSSTIICFQVSRLRSYRITSYWSVKFAIERLYSPHSDCGHILQNVKFDTHSSLSLKFESPRLLISCKTSWRKKLNWQVWCLFIFVFKDWVSSQLVWTQAVW
jgi:hypothetical protein